MIKDTPRYPPSFNVDVYGKVLKTWISCQYLYARAREPTLRSGGPGGIANRAGFFPSTVGTLPSYTFVAQTYRSHFRFSRCPRRSVFTAPLKPQSCKVPTCARNGAMMWESSGAGCLDCKLILAPSFGLPQTFLAWGFQSEQPLLVSMVFACRSLRQGVQAESL